MPKQLGEFLEEQQEPFALQVYLLERGYMRNSFNSKHNFPRFYPKNSAQTLSRSASCALHKKRIFIPGCSKIVRSFFKKLVALSNERRKLKNSASEDQHVSVKDMENNRQEIPDNDKFSSASSTTLFNSCSDSDPEDAAQNNASVEGDSISFKADSVRAFQDGNPLSIKQIAADRDLLRRSVEESNQLSPVSVLEETEYDDGTEVLKTARKYVKRTQGGCLPTSGPSCDNNLEKAFESSAKEVQQVIGSKIIAHYAKNKKAVLETEQLLFDCVREIVEDQGRRRNNGKAGKEFQKFLGAEELWKLIYENIWLWSKEIIDETNIEHLLHYDVLASLEEWNNREEQRSEIGAEIAAAIFEDVTCEVIAEMI